jgi:hypothetical protein
MLRNPLFLLFSFSLIHLVLPTNIDPIYTVGYAEWEFVERLVQQRWARERGGGVTLGFSTYLFLSSRKRGRDMCLGFPINNRVIFWFSFLFLRDLLSAYSFVYVGGQLVRWAWIDGLPIERIPKDDRPRFWMGKRWMSSLNLLHKHT